MVHFGPLQIAGFVLAALALIAVGSVLTSMFLRRPRTQADIAARELEEDFEELPGTIIVIFSAEIRSEHMMVLAARLARGQRSELLAVYIIEVPFTYPADAVMEAEERLARETLAKAQAIAKKNGVDVRTEIVQHRQTTQGVLEVAKREKADLIVMGSYREGRYTGAPLGTAIETIAANAKCDVIIGVEGKHGTLLGDEGNEPGGTTDTRENV
ncbi:MAG: universal stress protein [Vulcanimicrobiaceae bacterium]